ncbi:MAG: acyl carrier protein [Acidobacteriota bacterium]
MEEFFKLCQKILAEHLSIDPSLIGMNTTFEEIEADSIDIVEMIMAVEDVYDVEFPEDDLEEFKTMGSLVKALYQYLENR